MPLEPIATLGIHDAKVRKLLTDPAGGTTTYDAWIDVPDMTSATLSGDTDVKERRGDGTVRDRRQVLTGMTLTFENTILSPQVLALLQGGTYAATGLTPNQQWTYDYTATSKPEYVQFEAQCIDVTYPNGDFHLIVWKGKVNNLIEVGMTDDEFQTYSFELGAVARNSDDRLYRLVGNETKAAIV